MAGLGTKLRGEQLYRLLGGKDLIRLGQSHHPGCNVDCIPVYVFGLHQGRAKVQPYTNGKRRSIVGGLFCEGLLHRTCSLYGGVNTRKRTQHSVPNGFNDSSFALTGHLSKERETLPYSLPGSLIAQHFIQTSAATNVSKENGSRNNRPLHDLTSEVVHPDYDGVLY